MKQKNLQTYLHFVKKSLIPVSDDLLEKDLMLSLFLFEMAKLDTPALDQLIFKGGTLLTKSYLNYHRISEDLDFTHKTSNDIIKIESKSNQEKAIKNLIIPIIK